MSSFIQVQTRLRKIQNTLGVIFSKRSLLVLCIVMASILRLPCHAQTQPLKAGAAYSNVTPFLDGGIVGGFATPPAATHIHDELLARCLVLDDGNKQIAIVVVDNLMMPREVIDYAKNLILKSTPLQKENILISSTHTHSSVSATGIGQARETYNYDKPLDEYQTFLARRISDGVRRAIQNKEPAKIAWGSVQVPQHVFNRRWKMKPGTPMSNPFGGQDKVVMNPGVGNPNLLEPAGPTDPEVFYVSVQALDSRPIALLANYSLHYVGGVPATHISSDYYGAFADRFQQLIGADHLSPGFVAMMSNGTSGDVNNINFKGPATPMPSYEKIKKVADDVAQEVYKGYKNLNYQTKVKLDAAYDELELAIRKPTPAMLARAKKVIADPNLETVHRLERFYASRIINMQEGWPEKVKVVLQVLKIGELAIATTPFETFAQTGLEIKAKSPFKSTFTIELANGCNAYLPTPEQHDLGGYEAWMGSNRVERDASVKMVNKLVELLQSLK